MGSLFIVSTPIGNLDDITVRAIHVLSSTRIIACEDTRVTGQLLHVLGEKYKNFSPSEISHTFVSYRDENEEHMVPQLLSMLEQGDDIALVSDAGTPLISDPGYRIINAAIQKHIPVQIIPGATACIAALVGSGLPPTPVTFLGYLPEKDIKRVAFLRSLTDKHSGKQTYSLYCAPHKLQQTLRNMKEVFGDIRIVIARELTKIHEEFYRDSITNCLTHFSVPKGEFVILFCL